MSLTGWLTEPRTGHGLRVATDDAGWARHDFPSLAAAALDVAGLLRGTGLRRGEVVSLLLVSPETFLAGFFGTLAAGGVVNPMPPPAGLGAGAAYPEQLTHLMRVAGTRTVLVDPHLAGTARSAAAAAGLAVTVLTVAGPDQPGDAGPGRPVAPAADDPQPPAGDEVALVQFTSGSSGHPRAVAIRADNLLANVTAIRRWLDMDAADVTATWLPTYHDMGLIGCTLAPVLNQSDILAMRPDQFIRSPRRWLSCFGEQGATLTAAPTFGYAYAARRIGPDELAGMDFSGWRAAIVGAERVSRHTLESFAALLGPYGFRTRTFLPAYGLAENTLVATGLHLAPPPVALRVAGELRPGEPVEVTAVEEVGTDPSADDDWLVGCGDARDGVAVTVVDDEGRTLPPDVVGEIALTGRSVAAGYHGPAAPDAAFAEGRLRTGDHGFLHDGQLFVLGRAGDSLKVRGRNLYAEDLEARLAGVDGLSPERVVVLAGSAGHTPVLHALIRQRPGPWAAEVARILGREGGPGVRIRVLSVPAPAVARTTSGKPRRRPMFRAATDGTLPGEVLYDSAEPAAWPR
ncbi:AMP-binding protein [Micromonospora humida]|uniref:AMP-binding protein n=1 Tax=Micromonospora humida TaxID=2809018 RepID=UPI0033FA8D46